MILWRQRFNFNTPQRGFSNFITFIPIRFQQRSTKIINKQLTQLPKNNKLLFDKWCFLHKIVEILNIFSIWRGAARFITHTSAERVGADAEQRKLRVKSLFMDGPFYKINREYVKTATLTLKGLRIIICRTRTWFLLSHWLLTFQFVSRMS